MSPSKPRVLILGGCGFIGRNLVHYLVKFQLCSSILVLDKVRPSLVFLNDIHKSSFDSPIVKYKQSNVRSPESLADKWKVKEAKDVDYVFNLASEVRYDEPDLIYNESILGIVETLIAETKKHPSVKRIFDLSTAQIYPSKKDMSNESTKPKPWTGIATFKLKAEEMWMKSGLPVVILRPATVYGPGDISGLMSRLTCARIYKFRNEQMSMLWDAELRINTVHVEDICRALWHLTTAGPSNTIYNLADKTNLTQGKFNIILQNLFGIRTGFINSILCKFTLLNPGAVKEYINSKHLRSWSNLCAKFHIDTTPISPVMVGELLQENNLAVDGKFIETTGFKYEHPQVTLPLIQEQLEYWLSQRVFPPMDESEYESETKANELDLLDEADVLAMQQG